MNEYELIDKLHKNCIVINMPEQLTSRENGLNEYGRAGAVSALVRRVLGGSTDNLGASISSHAEKRISELFEERFLDY